MVEFSVGNGVKQICVGNERLGRPSAFERERNLFGCASRVAAHVSQTKYDRDLLMTYFDKTGKYSTYDPRLVEVRRLQELPGMSFSST